MGRVGSERNATRQWPRASPLTARCGSATPIANPATPSAARTRSQAWSLVSKRQACVSAETGSENRCGAPCMRTDKAIRPRRAKRGGRARSSMPAVSSSAASASGKLRTPSSGTADARPASGATSKRPPDAMSRSRAKSNVRPATNTRFSPAMSAGDVRVQPTAVAIRFCEHEAGESVGMEGSGCVLLC